MPDSNLADGDVLTSSFYNTYVREQVVVTCTSATRPTGVEGRLIYETDTNAIKVYSGASWFLVAGSSWNTFTPSWTNLTVGNGTVSADYCYAPGGYRVRVTLVFGSTTSISGNVAFAIPNSETSRAGARSLGQCQFVDSGTRTYDGSAVCNASSSSVLLNHDQSGNAGSVNATNPFTFTTGDSIVVDIVVAL